MKYYTLLMAVLLLGSLSANCQIPTPDFRYYTKCPVSLSEVDVCTGWREPTGGTPDYYNVCHTGDQVGVPQNGFGYQTSAQNAYVGLICYLSISGDYKEYIATDFPPLSIGRSYTMTIAVSLAESSNFAIDGLGIFFTTYPVNNPTTGITLPVTPQVDYSSYGVIKDKANWVTLSKSFVADSAYTNLTLGCFKPLGKIQVDSVGGGSQYSRNAYYYIGQVGIADPTRHSDTDHFTPPDLTGPTPIDTTKIVTIDTTKIITTDTLKFVFPNAFTPNNNGSNEIFRIIGSDPGLLGGYSLGVYNRWGQRVFYTNNPYSGWNGTYNNVLQAIGTYFYICAFTLFGEYKTLKGDVTLLR